MKCPLCSVDLLMMTRKQVEIDCCPQCRGVWLDRGELEKIIAELAPGQIPHGDQANLPSNTNQMRPAGRRRSNDYSEPPYLENRYGDHRRH